MKFYQRGAVCLSVWSVVLISSMRPIPALAADCVRVNLYNKSVYAHTYTIRVQAKCSCIGNMTWNTPIAANGPPVPIGICSNHALKSPEGYGEFWYHVDGQPANAPWNHAALLSDGQNYTM